VPSGSTTAPQLAATLGAAITRAVTTLGPQVPAADAKVIAAAAAAVDAYAGVIAAPGA
jgi:hypothetical protein